MKAYRVETNGGPDAIQRVDLPEPEHGAWDVLVDIRACSLNFRDLAVSGGGYFRNDRSPVIPLSDASGEVIAVGDAVTAFKPGDKVVGSFMQDWIDGEPNDAVLRTGLGGGIDGVLRERMIFPQHGLVKMPAHLSFEEAACLPCAAVTAWQAFEIGGLRPGDTVLLLGTGGVSIFGLQLAKLFGASAIVTSSSDDKLEIARSLGADHVINYRVHENWAMKALEITGGRGVDHVLEVGGSGTLQQSVIATRPGGVVSMIGAVGGAGGEAVNPMIAVLNRTRLQGVLVGSRAMLERMNRATAASGLRPRIDRVFPFDEAIAAYKALAGQAHVGKIVIAR